MFNHSVRSRRLRIGIIAALFFFTLGVAGALPGGPSGVQAASGPARSTAAVTSPGTIAYISGDLHHIHLIQPDGSNDHVIWNAPTVGGVQSTVDSVGWRPDSAELAFVSDMEQTASIYQFDIYGIAPDGSSLRRISNPPDVSQLGSFPKASVDVTVRNHDLSDSVVLVYVGGAVQPQDTVIPAGTSKVVHFDNVAVFQGHAQFPVVIDGNTRWVGFPNGQFQPGTTNQASVDVYANTGRDNFGTYYPVWRTDGAEVDDPLGAECIGEGWSASAPPGATTSQLIQASASMCAMARGWTAAQADQILYYDAVAFAYPDSFGAIMQVKEGSTDAGTRVFDPGYYGAVTALEYLPDGSGFLFSYRPDVTDTAIDLYRCTIPCSTPVQLTHFDGAYVGGFAISPDGQYVAFERTTGDPLDPNASHPYDLWMMKIDGSQQGLFVSNARIPSWSRGTPRILGNKVYLPAIFR